MKAQFLIATVLILFALNTQSQIIVKIKPVIPVPIAVVKPCCPGPKYVWVEGHWMWNERIRQYVWIDGYWMKIKKGKNLAPGHWVGNGQWKWIPGHLNK